jgi:hypothetical protein
VPEQATEYVRGGGRVGSSVGGVTEPTWDQLPARLRERIDELVLADERFRATCELWLNGGRERIPLPQCQLLIFERYQHFGEQVRRKPQASRDVPTLIAKVEALPVRPDAIEALWDGDSDGWMVCLYAVTREPQREFCLAFIRHGTDMRVFNAVVPPWTETDEATESGTALARHFGVPFFFLNPDVPDLPETRWWDTV